MAQQPLPGIDSERSQRRVAKGRDKRRGRLQVHDPFELIRWLALSQPDPRKALAELVQNSFDAKARHVEIERFRRRRTTYLAVRDDGEGVIPELGREDALRFLATHIGHSRKRSLTPQQRLELMTQGQYGIGLLGFWSLGHLLEMRTFMPGEKAQRLVLERNRPEYRIETLRGPTAKHQWTTEILIVGVHREALPVLGARRVSDYLATELRGQLLQREVELSVSDRLARGRAPRRLVIEPKRFPGIPIVELESVNVPGFPPIRLDLYLDHGAGGEDGGLALYAAGTLVCESFRDLAALRLNRAPFVDGRLSGVVDFPALTVSPGSRRGVVVDDAAAALREALEGIAPRLQHLLDLDEERRREELDRGTVQNLQRVFRDLFRQRPRYELLPVEDRGSRGSGRGGDEGEESGGASSGVVANDEGLGGGEVVDSQLEESPTTIEVSAASVPPVEASPSGPLFEVRLRPSRLRIACGATRLVRAEPLDESGRLVDGPCEYLWRLCDVEGTLEDQVGTAPRVRVLAGVRPGSGLLRVTAVQGSHRAGAQIPVEMIASEEVGPGAREGVPEPELVHDAGGRWRSRLVEDRWQVNSAHPDFAAVAERPALRLRYLALLFAKEVVLRTSKDPRLEQPLEEMVEIFGFADQRLAPTGPRKTSRRRRRKRSRTGRTRSG